MCNVGRSLGISLSVRLFFKPEGGFFLTFCSPVVVGGTRWFDDRYLV